VCHISFDLPPSSLSTLTNQSTTPSFSRSREYLQRLGEGSGNVDPHGNFSIQVLRSALQNQFGLELPNLRQEGIINKEPTTMEGFICNKQSHWFAIRKINGRYWNLNSTAERPVCISHFNVATELDKLIADGYSVFCADKPLPQSCNSTQEMERRKARQHGGVKGNWWRESDLIRGVRLGINGSKGGDPWKNVGSGMRLDGRAPSSSFQQQQQQQHPSADVINALTEEEQIQMVIAASLEPTTQSVRTSPKKGGSNVASVPVPPEPAAGTPGSVRIQFRLPSNPRIVRRFMETDLVAVVVTFCREQEGGNDTSLDLRYGFPPKDLLPLANQTIGEAKLSGESIQGRLL